MKSLSEIGCNDIVTILCFAHMVQSWFHTVIYYKTTREKWLSFSVSCNLGIDVARCWECIKEQHFVGSGFVSWRTSKKWHGQVHFKEDKQIFKNVNETKTTTSRLRPSKIVLKTFWDQDRSRDVNILASSQNNEG